MAESTPATQQGRCDALHDAAPALLSTAKSALYNGRAPDGGGFLIRHEDYMAMRAAIAGAEGKGVDR